MRRTKALKKRLEVIAHVFAGFPVTVQFGERPRALPDGKTVVVDPNIGRFVGTGKLDGPNEIRLIINTLNHEVAHLLQTDLEAKRRLSEKYEKSHDAGHFAGFVYNVLEDQYVDLWRTNEWRGLRRTQAFYVSVVMQNHIRRGNITDRPHIEALIEGFFQVSFTGTANGIGAVTPALQDTLSWAKSKATEYRELDSPEDRERVACEVIDYLLDHISNPSVAEAYVKDMVAPVEPPVGELEDKEVESYSELSEEKKEEALTLPEEDCENLPEEEVIADERDTETPTRPQEPKTTDVDEMIEQDESEQTSDWYSDSSDEELWDAGDDMREEYERVRRNVGRGQDNLYQAMRRRDERIGEKQEYPHIQEEIASRAFTEDIEDAFYELKTRDVKIPAIAGSQVDVRRAIRRLLGDYSVQRVNTRRKRAELGDRAVGVALDLSGSMDVFEAKVALGALYIAVEIIGDEVVINGFHTISPGDAYQVTSCPLVTSPVEDFEWPHLDAAYEGGFTPTAAGIYRCLDLLEECSKPQKVMFVITDGKPNITLQGERFPEVAIKQAYSAVQDARRHGVRVIGLGVGEDIDEGTLRELFGVDGYIRADSANFTSELIGAYYSQMNVVSGSSNR